MSVPRRVLTVLLLAGSPALTAAQPPVGGPGVGERVAPPPPRERPARQPESGTMEVRQQRRSLSEAVRWVQRSTGGQILGAELVPYEGRNITRVKYMDDRGRVRYMDDPGSGERSRRPRRDDHESR